GRLQRAIGERHVEIELVARRPHHGALDPGHIPGSADVEAGHIVAVMVGGDHQAVAALLQHLRLLPDPHVAAVVGEEAGWGDHQDRLGHEGAFPRFTIYDLRFTIDYHLRGRNRTL